MFGVLVWVGGVMLSDLIWTGGLSLLLFFLSRTGLEITLFSPLALCSSLCPVIRNYDS